MPTNPAEKAAADRPHTAVVDWEVEDGIAAALRRCVLEFGGLDVLVWCAPAVPAQPLGDLTGGTRHGVIRGLTGYVNCARSAARIFTHQKMVGQILYVEPPDDGEVRRTAAAALSGAAAAMNRAWSQEFADAGIRVNALAHVADDTPDAADLLRFLAGGHSRALNGQTLQCAG